MVLCGVCNEAFIDENTPKTRVNAKLPIMPDIKNFTLIRYRVKLVGLYKAG
jgi:hypothetical protein